MSGRSSFLGALGCVWPRYLLACEACWGACEGWAPQPEVGGQKRKSCILVFVTACLLGAWITPLLPSDHGRTRGVAKWDLSLLARVLR